MAKSKRETGQLRMRSGERNDKGHQESSAFVRVVSGRLGPEHQPRSRPNESESPLTGRMSRGNVIRPLAPSSEQADRWMRNLAMAERIRLSKEGLNLEIGGLSLAEGDSCRNGARNASRSKLKSHAPTKLAVAFGEEEWIRNKSRFRFCKLQI